MSFLLKSMLMALSSVYVITCWPAVLVYQSSLWEVLEPFFLATVCNPDSDERHAIAIFQYIVTQWSSFLDSSTNMRSPFQKPERSNSAL
ncbi:hypothetical protein, no similarity [Geotrichum candidum]|uniref:Uncharacterized protein n=1 Tax=Geotrichum candidum TaxID=1173061 RepID=A0A0J9XEF2_GEOCN|nr:hypothetical protein, no similarity [Geotrichum candidum]